MKYRLGLDIGIASVGWCVMEHDAKDNSCRIVDLGSRVFTPAEKPKTGESPTVERRIARGIRRNIRRKKYRLERLSQYLDEIFLHGEKIDFSCDAYEMRVKALDCKVSNNELCRVIYHLAKHRGFRSNRKAEIASKDSQKMVAAIQKTSEESKSYRSVGEMYLKDERFFQIKEKYIGSDVKSIKVLSTRNGINQYDKTLLREDVLAEARLILKTQQSLGNKDINQNVIDKILYLIDYQKSYDEGPDYPSPFHVSFNVGDCTFLSNEKRAPKASFSQEYFTALCDINNLKVDGEFLNESQRKILIDSFLSSKEISYGKVRKLLNIAEDLHLTGKSGSEDDKRVFVKRIYSYEILKKLSYSQTPKENWDLLDDIAYVLSMFKSDDNRMTNFNKRESTKDLPDNIKESLCELDFNKFGNLSIKALKMIIPYLEKGQNYQAACFSAGLSHQDCERKIKLKVEDLPELKELTSPVVKRSVSQTIKVVNAIIEKYGSPCAIFIELGREMGRNFKDRKQMERDNLANSDNNEKLKERLRAEFGITNPSGHDIVKLKLYDEQGGKCAYSGKSFTSIFGNDMSAIFSNNNTQVDHIIPYSRCYNDSYNNKVLVLSSENQLKGDRIPFEYFGNDEDKWNAFVARVMSWSNKKKRENCLRTKLSEQQEQELNNRALNDTRYIAKFMKEIFENHLLFENSSLHKKPVRTINGGMTSFLRKIWGIKKERFADDKHHAVDAAIVACTDNGMIQRATKFQQANRAKKMGEEIFYIDYATGERISIDEVVKRYGKNYQMPYENFKVELDIRISNNVLDKKKELADIGYSSEELDEVRVLNVSRMVDHKVKGAIHEQTIRSKKLAQDGNMIAVTKTKIQDLKIGKDGEIEGYPQQFRDDDRKLYDALKRQLLQFGGEKKEGKLAFKEPFFKPSKNPNNRNEVKTVKLQKVISDAVEVNGGVAENSSMIRIDVFEKKGKTYFIPVYVKDYYNKKLPNKVCKACPYQNWPELDGTYTFKFSLFQNDVVKIRFAKPKKFSPCDKNSKDKGVELDNLFVYYTGACRSGASISVETLDKKYKIDSLGLQNALKFEKYEIDILGNLRKVEKEKRKEFI